MDAPLVSDSDQPAPAAPADSPPALTAVEMGRRRWAGVSAADRSEAMRKLAKRRLKKQSPEKRKKIASQGGVASKKARLARAAAAAAAAPDSDISSKKPRKKRGRPKKFSGK